MVKNVANYLRSINGDIKNVPDGDVETLINDVDFLARLLVYTDDGGYAIDRAIYGASKLTNDDAEEILNFYRENIQQQNQGAPEAQQEQATQTIVEQAEDTQAAAEQEQATQTPAEQAEDTQAAAGEQEKATQTPAEQEKATKATAEQEEATQTPAEQEKATKATAEQEEATQTIVEQAEDTQAAAEQEEATQTPAEQAEVKQAAAEEEQATQAVESNQKLSYAVQQGNSSAESEEYMQRINTILDNEEIVINNIIEDTIRDAFAQAQGDQFSMDFEEVCNQVLTQIEALDFGVRIDNSDEDAIILTLIADADVRENSLERDINLNEAIRNIGNRVMAERGEDQSLNQNSSFSSDESTDNSSVQSDVTTAFTQDRIRIESLLDDQEEMIMTLIKSTVEDSGSNDIGECRSEVLQLLREMDQPFEFNEEEGTLTFALDAGYEYLLENTDLSKEAMKRTIDLNGAIMTAIEEAEESRNSKATNEVAQETRNIVGEMLDRGLGQGASEEAKVDEKAAVEGELNKEHEGADTEIDQEASEEKQSAAKETDASVDSQEVSEEAKVDEKAVTEGESAGKQKDVLPEVSQEAEVNEIHYDPPPRFLTEKMVKYVMNYLRRVNGNMQNVLEGDKEKLRKDIDFLVRMIAFDISSSKYGIYDINHKFIELSEGDKDAINEFHSNDKWRNPQNYGEYDATTGNEDGGNIQEADRNAKVPYQAPVVRAFNPKISQRINEVVQYLEFINGEIEQVEEKDREALRKEVADLHQHIRYDDSEQCWKIPISFSNELMKLGEDKVEVIRAFHEKYNE